MVRLGEQVRPISVRRPLTVEITVPYYRAVGEIPRKRHTQFRKPDGGLYAEELMGIEGFSAESALLYHAGLPPRPPPPHPRRPAPRGRGQRGIRRGAPAAARHPPAQAATLQDPQARP